MKKIVLILVVQIRLITLFGQTDYPALELKGEVGNSYIFNQMINEGNALNPQNEIAKIPAWEDWTNLDLNLTLLFSRSLKFHLGMDNHFLIFNSDELTFSDGLQPQLHPKSYAINLRKLSMEGMLFNGLVVMEVGKTIREYGAGYIWKPTNFLYNEINSVDNSHFEKSKFLVDILLLTQYLNVELLYAPNSEYLPDDYKDFEEIGESDDFFLARVGISPGVHALNLLYYYNGASSVGLNYSALISDNLILYSEVVWSQDNRNIRLEETDPNIFSYTTMDNSYWQFLLGASYSPDWLDWTAYFEILYNGDGLTPGEWETFSNNLDKLDNSLYPQDFKTGVRGEGLESFRYNQMSFLYFGLHLQQNNKFFNHLKFKNTLFVSLPLGFYNQFGFQFDFPGNFLFEFRMKTIPYYSEYSEYAFFLNHNELQISLRCSF